MMTINNIKKVLVAGSLLLSVSACDHFEEMNVDPTKPAKTPTSYLLTQSQKSLVDLLFDMSIASFSDFGNHYAQLLSAGSYTDVSNYQTVESSFYSFYTGGLNDLEQIIQLNTDETTLVDAQASGSNENQIAVAKILQSWAFHNVTDIWGAVPYSEALKGNEVFKPKYDSQKEIYKGILETLSASVDMIDTGTAIEGDIIFGGDMTKWKKFANSLIMRIAMRAAEASGADFDAKAYFAAAAADAIASNADNAQLVYDAAAANSNPYYQWITLQGRRDYYVSDRLMSKLKDVVNPSDATMMMDDPRLTYYAQPSASGSIYAGMPYGNAQGEVTGDALDQYSFPGKDFVSATSPFVLMDYAEVEFLMAEAVKRGWVSGNAEDHYNTAVKAAITQYNTGITEAELDDYLTYIPYDDANWEESIHEQKWVAFYMQGLQAWAEQRRTNFPALAPSPNASEGRTIPARRVYAQNEFDLNGENLATGIEMNGGNDYNTKLWWDID
ncbi:SusD/RagB family nutrient-binding outer membrane lipoprotein [Limibacter armeniacum]|uniref:SusD/RagB family nutrient-binding outer membrane lipoprotein n=1 Tax=Limibacter armeniacum TaxID=466084 RepID=UPI002FE53F78